MSRQAVELLQPSFGKTPKALNAIDVMRSHNELMAAMIHAKMLSINNASQSVAAGSALREH